MYNARFIGVFYSQLYLLKSISRQLKTLPITKKNANDNKKKLLPLAFSFAPITKNQQA